MPKRAKTLRKAQSNRQKWVEEAKADVEAKSKLLAEAVEDLKKAMTKLGTAEDKLTNITGQLEQAIAEQEDEVVAKSSDSAGKLLDLLSNAVAQPGTIGDIKAAF